MPIATQFLSLETLTRERICALREGRATMFGCGLSVIDEMNAGGIASGEYCVVGARTSNGKSMFGLQWVYHVAQKFPCLIVSAEMGPAALATRAIQFSSAVDEKYWSEEQGNAELFDDAVGFFQPRRPILVAQNVRHIDQVVQAISEAKTHHGVRFVLVDYLQKIRGLGQSRYEQVSHVSSSLAAAAVEYDVALVALAQLSRSSVTEAKEFVPKLHHLKESGDIEQDADVIMFLAWPWKMDTKHPPHEYLVYGAKNRNRGVRGASICKLRFDPPRQMLSEPDNYERARDNKNYRTEFDEFNEDARIQREFT